MSAFCIIISHFFFLLRSINKKLNHGVKFLLWPKKKTERKKKKEEKPDEGFAQSDVWSHHLYTLITHEKKKRNHYMKESTRSQVTFGWKDRR